MYEKDDMMHDSSCDADKNKFFTEDTFPPSPEMIPEKSTKLTIQLVSQVTVVRYSQGENMGIYGKKMREFQENGSFTGEWEARFGLRLGKIAGPPQVQ